MICTIDYILLTNNYPSSVLEGPVWTRIPDPNSIPTVGFIERPTSTSQPRERKYPSVSTHFVNYYSVHTTYLLCSRTGRNLSWIRGACASYNVKSANCIVNTHTHTHTHYATGVSTLVWAQDSNWADKSLVWTFSGCRITVDTSASGKKDPPHWPSHPLRCYTTYLKAEVGNLYGWFCHSITC